MKMHVSALVTAIAVASIATSSGFGQDSNGPFSITIRADKPTVLSGSRVYIWITLKNESDHDVDCSSARTNGMDRRYLYDVRNEDGKSALKPDIDPDRYPISVQSCEFAPNEKLHDNESQISWLYDFTRPGTYTVQVSRFIGDDEKQGVVKSNTITITVVAPGTTPDAPK